MVHDQAARASACALPANRAAATQAPTPRRPLRLDEPEHDERLVIGALVTGALGVRDVTDLGWHFHFRVHVELLSMLVSILDVTGRRSVDLALGLLACQRLGLHGMGASWADASGRVVGRTGYLPGLARAAPRRREALEAVARVRRRWDLLADREAVLLAAEDAAREGARGAVAALLDRVRADGGLLGGRGAPVQRPIDREAIPELGEVMGRVFDDGGRER